VFNPMDLSNKRILITGASSGIGRATAIYLSKLGAKTVLLARNEDRLNDTIIQLENDGHMYIVADLAESEDMTHIFDKSVENGTKLSGLVHSAGFSQVIPINMLTKDRMQKEMNINYFSFIELVRQFSKKKYNQGGSIVGVSSIAADKAEQCQTNYSASKAAMNIAAQALSLELAKKQIRINTVMPGAVYTSMAMHMEESGIDMSEIEKLQLLGMGKAEQVASVIAFLLSDMSSFITGRNVFADGGRFL